MTTLGLIRHGVTDWNLAGRMQGHTDIPLNETGIWQAKQLARRLADEGVRWEAIYSSDLKRASETARYICEALQLDEVRLDPRLRERGFGLAEGLTVQERAERFGPGLEEAGVESAEQVLERCKQFLEDLLARGESRILIVSHGGFLWRFFSLLDPEMPDVHLGNASLTIMELVDGKWQVQLVNCTVHYEGAVPTSE